MKHKRIQVVSIAVLAGAMTLAAVQALAQEVAAGPAAPAASQPAQTPELSMLDLLLKGGVFMIPIGLGSLLGLALIIERVWSLRRGQIIQGGWMDGLKAAFRHGDDRQAGLSYCRSRDCPMARIVSAGIHKLHAGEAAIEEAIEDAGANEVSKLRTNLRLLFGVAAVSPMIGLLGSVSGMIRSFQVASVQGVGRAELLSKGIYEALVCTYGGLLVAIPTLIFYYYFLNKIDRLVTEMNDVSREFLEHYVVPADKEL